MDGLSPRALFLSSRTKRRGPSALTRLGRTKKGKRAEGRHGWAIAPSAFFVVPNEVGGPSALRASGGQKGKRASGGQKGKRASGRQGWAVAPSAFFCRPKRSGGCLAIARQDKERELGRTKRGSSAGRSRGLF